MSPQTIGIIGFVIMVSLIFLRVPVAIALGLGLAGSAFANVGAQAIGGEIRDKLHAEAEENRKALEGKLNAQLADAEKQIAATKTAAMTNVRGIAVEAAAAIVERLIGTAPSAPALAAAVADARSKAEALATAGGAQLGQVMTIQETSASSPPPIFYDRGMAASSAAVPTPVSPPTLESQVSVTVVWTLT